MKYTASYFDVQIRFAEQISKQFSLSISTCLYDYTTLTKSLGIDSDVMWQEYMLGYVSSMDKTCWTYQFYRSHKGSLDVILPDGTFDGNVLFGYFYYGVRDEHILRPHFIKSGLMKQSVLGREQMTERILELTAMFAHIKANLPQVDVVLGNSWLYNLDAYCRLFPPEYTKDIAVSPRDDFQFLVRWGQLYDRNWNVRPDMVEKLLKNLTRIDRIEDIPGCFPFPILLPTCDIGHFYDFYGV